MAPGAPGTVVVSPAAEPVPTETPIPSLPAAIVVESAPVAAPDEAEAPKRDLVALFEATCREIAMATQCKLIGKTFALEGHPYGERVETIPVVVSPTCTSATLMQKTDAGFRLLGNGDRIWRREGPQGCPPPEWRHGGWYFEHVDARDSTIDGWKPVKEWHQWKHRYSSGKASTQ